MHVVIVGGSGLLGSEVVQAAHYRGWEIEVPRRSELDITDDRSITAYFLHVQPDWIINCAAYTAVDDAESDKDKAYQLNAFGPYWLGRVAQWTDARILQISTDFVFDGEKREPYTEDDAPNPQTVYGASKLQGETSLMDARPQSIIVRTAWLFGAGGKCFPRTIIEAAKAGKPLRVVDDQVGSPTYTQDLAAAITHLVELNPDAGVYNIVNSNVASWHQLATATLAAADIEAEVVPVKSSEFPRPAKRPAYSVLSTEKYQSLGLSPLPNWADAVRRYVPELKDLGVI